MQWTALFMSGMFFSYGYCKKKMFSFVLFNADGNTLIFNLTMSNTFIPFNPKYISDFVCFYNDDVNL